MLVEIIARAALAGAGYEMRLDDAMRRHAGIEVQPL
jgi:hypothetical protein